MLTALRKQKLYTKSFRLLCFANLLMATGFYFLIPALPVYIVDVLDAGPGKVGYVIAVYTLSALIIRPFAGYSIDRFGRKWIYLISFLSFTILMGFYALAVTFLWLMILRFLHGLTWGVSTTSASTIVVDIVPRMRRGEGIGIYGLSFTLAMAVGPIIALAILKKGTFNQMFFAAMAISLTGFLLMLTMKFPKYHRPTESKKISLSEILEYRTLPMSLIQLLFGLTYGGLMSFITLYALEYNVGQPGLFFSIFAVGIAVSRLVSGRIFDRKGPTLLIITGLASGTVGFVILGLFTTFTGFIMAALSVGICLGIVMPTLQAMVNNVVEPQRRGAANATFITAFDIGIGVGSMLLGLVAEFSSYKAMYLYSAGIILISFIVFFAFVQGFYNRHKLDEQIENTGS